MKYLNSKKISQKSFIKSTNTWHVDMKIPGGIHSQYPVLYTTTFDWQALLNDGEAELASRISGDHIL